MWCAPISRQESLEYLHKVLQAGAYTRQALTLREHERPHRCRRGLEHLREKSPQSGADRGLCHFYRQVRDAKPLGGHLRECPSAVRAYAAVGQQCVLHQVICGARNVATLEVRFAGIQTGLDLAQLPCDQRHGRRITGANGDIDARSR